MFLGVFYRVVFSAFFMESAVFVLIFVQLPEEHRARGKRRLENLPGPAPRRSPFCPVPRTKRSTAENRDYSTNLCISVKAVELHFASYIALLEFQ